MKLREDITNPRIIKTFEGILSRFKEAHGNKYDYSQAIYAGVMVKIKIICPIHGEFFQTPMQHITRNGCVKCSRANSAKLRAMTKVEFLEKAKNRHKNKYDYSLINSLKTASDIVSIICPKHGIFTQKATSHIGGAGCPRCGTEQSIKVTRKTFETFIQEANMVHHNKYDYSKVIWKGSNNKVIIICPIHGEFIQQAHTHTAGHGCTKCGQEILRYTTEIFIEKAKAKHQDKYDYSNVEYLQSTKKVKIICPTHGEFLQTPTSHMGGSGCPVCSRYIFPTEKHKNTPTYFYVVKYKELYKIGISLENAKTRYKYEVDDISILEVLHEQEFAGYNEAFTFEQSLITKYFKYRYRGKKIFKNTGNTEVFTEDIYQMYLQEANNE